MNPTEEQHTAWLQRWQSGDQHAGVAFFDAYYLPVLCFFRNKVSVMVCDDLVQQTFMAAAQARFNGRAAVKTWLFAIAWRKLADHCRREERRRRVEVLDFSVVSVADLALSPHTQLEHRAEARLLLEGLRRLPLVMQTALELHYWERMSAQQISSVLDVPLGTVKSRIRDGRARLARELTRIAVDEEVLRTTLDDLDGWAKRIRAAVETG